MGFRHWTVRAPMHNVSLARRPVPIVNWDQNCRHSYGVSGPALGTVEVMKGTRGDQKSPATLAAGVLLSLLAPPPWYCWHGVSSRQDRLEHCRVFRSTPGPHTHPRPQSTVSSDMATVPSRQSCPTKNHSSVGTPTSLLSPYLFIQPLRRRAGNPGRPQLLGTVNTCPRP